MGTLWPWTGVACSILAFALPTPVRSAPQAPRIDHASICSANFKEAREALEAAGLVPDTSAIQNNGSTSTAHIGFNDGTYLELIGPSVPGSPVISPWADLISANAGPCFWFAGSADVAAEAQRLKASGIRVAEPASGGRKSADGSPVEWVSLVVGSGPLGAVLPLMIEDKTPRKRRIRPSQSLAASRLAGIEKVVIGVADLERTIALFRQAYGLGNPVRERQPGFGELAAFPDAPVVLAHASGGWLAERVHRLGDGPVAYLIGTRDFGGARSRHRLIRESKWFGRKIGWFERTESRGIRLAVIAVR